MAVMFSVALGLALAFGLGGRDAARELLEEPMQARTREAVKAGGSRRLLARVSRVGPRLALTRLAVYTESRRSGWHMQCTPPPASRYWLMSGS